jgi:uncharacterized protein (DUF2252 family)
MLAVRAGQAFDGKWAIPGGALVLTDGGRISGIAPGSASRNRPSWGSLRPAGGSTESRVAEFVAIELVRRWQVSAVDEKQARAAGGRAARARVPRSSHAAWERPQDRPDPVTVLEKQAKSRLPDLVPIRYGRMATSEFAFFRGGAAIMAADLGATPVSGFRVQLCGDAHLANFGGFASPERDLVFSINDFDETIPGPWEWDVKRLAASLAISGRERGFGAKDRAAVVTAAISRYRQTMREFAAQRNLDVWYARLDAAGMLDRWGQEAKGKTIRRFNRGVSQAYTKDSLRAFAKFCQAVDGRPRISSDPPLVVAVDDLLPAEDLAKFERGARNALRGYQQSLASDRRHLLEGFRYAHVARKVVGVGSVGTRCWILLLLGRDDEDPLFLQLKEAEDSVLAPFAGASRFRNQGQRVVEGQRLMQSSSDILLGWFRTAGIDGTPRDFYVRQLWDWKMSADIDRMAPSGMRICGEACGWTLARAHARSGDRIAIAEYLGAGPRFEQAIAEFSEVYADQNGRDYGELLEAIRTGRITAEQGV